MAGDNKGREDLTAWQSSPVFHHVSLHPSNAGLPLTACHPCSCRVAAPELPSIDVPPPLLSLGMTPPPCLQYVDTMQEQLADLETYTSRRYVQSSLYIPHRPLSNPPTCVLVCDTPRRPHSIRGTADVMRTCRVDVQLLHSYKEHAHRIADQLVAPVLPAFCLPLPPQGIPSVSVPQPAPPPLFTCA